MKSAAPSLACTLFLLAALAAPAAGAGYLYGLSSTGNVSVNGNKIDSLPSDFDPDYPWYDTQLAWRDLAIVDGSRYAIRGDGNVYRNGESLWRLQYDSDSEWFWTEIEVADGRIYSLRQNGLLAVDDDVTGDLPRNDFYFTSLAVLDGAAYSLRSDGSVFKNNGGTALFNFRAGRGLLDENDGRAIDTIWTALKLDPSGDYLYALRSDGILYRGALPSGDEDGEYVDGLPFETQEDHFNYGDLYHDFELQGPGRWVALRVNGEVYRYPDAFVPDADFPGGGNEFGDMYLDLEVFDGLFFALQGNGKVYVEGLTDYLVSLPGGSYGRIALSTIPPALEDAKNTAPYVVTYTVPVNTGGAVKIPIVATDVETPEADLVVTPVETPPGSAWDAGTRTLTWTAPAEKGNWSFSYVVDDGAGSAKTYTSKIQVKAPDADPAKNKAPYAPKFKKAMALVGIEYRLYIPLDDPDGDPVTVTTNGAAYPFNAGAYYLPGTSEFVWTPTNLDIGKHTVELVLNDGVTEKTLKIKIEVKSPLFVVELP